MTNSNAAVTKSGTLNKAGTISLSQLIADNGGIEMLVKALNGDEASLTEVALAILDRNDIKVPKKVTPLDIRLTGKNPVTGHLIIDIFFPKSKRTVRYTWGLNERKTDGGLKYPSPIFKVMNGPAFGNKMTFAKKQAMSKRIVIQAIDQLGVWEKMDATREEVAGVANTAQEVADHEIVDL